MAIGDEKRKLIIADRVNGDSIRAIANKYGVSTTTVQRVIKSDDEVTQKVTQKQIENTQSVLEYIDQKTEDKKRLVDKLLRAMEQKADTVDMFTNIKDYATAYGIIMDKEVKLAEIHLGGGAGKENESDALSKSLMELAGELDAD